MSSRQPPMIAIRRHIPICHESNQGKQHMSETTSRMSRRHVLAVLAGALGLAVPTTVLTVSEAEAQTIGMERRQDRRLNRRDRRDDRRLGRHERRQDRRTGL
jgi:hypothetical protein